MEASRDIDIKRNFTILDESIWRYVLDSDIRLVDAVIYAAIKTQNDAEFGDSMGSISRIYRIPRATTERCINRLKDVGLVSVTYNKGKAKIQTKHLDSNEFEKIPKTLLMNADLNLQQKAFMLASWYYIKDGYLEYSKSSLQKYVFNQYHKKIDWVSARVNELIDFGLLEIDGRSMKIDYKLIVEMSDTVISSVQMESSHLEDVVVAYEDKTGVTRDKIFDWKETGEVVKKEFNSPKWLEPITNAINAGCVALNKKPFDFTAGEFATIGKHVKDIIENIDGDSEERIIEKIANSIIWKTNNASRNENEKKYYTKGFFTRKTKNNLASNLYHFERDLESNPYGNSKPSVTKVTKKVTKETGGFELFDYGIDL